MKCSFLLGIVAWSYVTSSFGMMTDEADREMGADSAERNKVIVASTSAQVPLELHSLEEIKTALVIAVKENNCRHVFEYYDRFNKLDELWEQEAETLHVPTWESSLDFKSQIGAQLFWDAAIDTPHENLLRQALKPLVIAPSSEWEATYNNCIATVSSIIKTHKYLHVPARAYAIAISAYYGNPIAKLFTLEFLRFLSPEDEGFFRKGHFTVSYNLKNNDCCQSSLREFLSPNTTAFVDPEDKELDNEDTLIRMSNLGLPHYHILLGDYYFRKMLPITSQTPQEDIDRVLQLSQAAINGGDPSGYLSQSGILSSIGKGVGIKRLTTIQKNAFLRGYFEMYSSLPRDKKKELKNYTKTLYDNLKKLLLQRSSK